MFVKKNNLKKTLLIISMHVNYTLLAKRAEKAALFKTEIQKRFKIKKLGPFSKHLGINYNCWNIDSNGNQFVIATMGDLIQKIIFLPVDHLKGKA